ncbi:MAG: hypothetical protein ASARMPRED_007221 [Alectoria sarmentosa]|nr:MAG: hypothetical protein ASARMPRED_007221 [Alectoria sarmentosa]
MSHFSVPSTDGARTTDEVELLREKEKLNKACSAPVSGGIWAAPQTSAKQGGTNGSALTDTPLTTAPNSPMIPPRRRDSGTSTPASRHRPTTLDIPGLTKSSVSPDGRIAQRDVGSKLVIVMVGLPARGKSYVTKKIARYLNWLQHDTRIFNVGERRRVAAGGLGSNAPPGVLRPQQPLRSISTTTGPLNGVSIDGNTKTVITPSTKIVIDGGPPTLEMLPSSALDLAEDDTLCDSTPDTVSNGNIKDGKWAPETVARPLRRTESMEKIHDASFFDPNNEQAAQIRDQIAMATLDELLDYILDQGGSVGIFDATNSTLERRKLVMERIRERAGSELGVLFLESLCVDEQLLESNMRLKLSGPDYRDQDPVVALDDFKKRVALYQSKYVPLGEYEEKNNMPYVQMIDVGRKVVSHQIRGFLSAQTVYYLLNFNLAPRQIWITRHGESVDNVHGRIGGDSDLSEKGIAYARALTKFIKNQRQAWDVHQRDKALSTHFPPLPGDTTPPNPEYNHGDPGTSENAKSFCVWTSMLKRSIQTAQFFDEDDYDTKQFKMLDELNAGTMEGLTYEEIRTKHNEEFRVRQRDKLHYRCGIPADPGAGGEGYLDIINRLRAVIVEVERMTDHVLLVGHRSVARVLLAYFKGLKREDVADLDVPLGMLYMLEPKPYGVEFQAYRYEESSDRFSEVHDYQLRRATSHLSN